MSESDAVSVVVAPPTETLFAAAQVPLDVHLVALYASPPGRTAMVIFTSHSNPGGMASLNARKVAFKSAIKNRKMAEEMRRAEWTASDGRALEVGKLEQELFLGIKMYVL